MAEPLLALEGVTLRTPEGHPVFRDLDWRLERGARFHLKADREGSASAFLRLCCGLAQPDTGRVILDGASLATLGATPRHPFLERAALGYVPSDGGLAVNLTLQENAELPLRFALGLCREAAAQRAALWLERAGLQAFARQRPHVPGDGQSWLASLARSAAKGAELWLVDRPPGGLDARSIRAALEILARVGEDPKVTLLLVGEDWMAPLGQALNLEEDRVCAGRHP